MSTPRPPTSRSRRRKPTQPVPIARLIEVGLDVEGWDECPPRCVSPRPKGRGVYFDAGEVARVVRVLRAMPHSKAEWAGRPFDLDAWQLVWIIAPIVGWKDRKTGLRVFRNAFICVPRKAGKSTLASRLAAYLLTADGEPGAEVYAAAASRDQAMVVGADVCSVVSACAPIARKCEVMPRSGRVLVPANGSVFRPLSRVAELAHGLNVHGAVVDELHVHKHRGLLDAIETGTQARRQPLVIIITTPDEGKDGTIFDERFREAEQIGSGVIAVPDQWVAQWGAEQDDDPFDEAVWYRAQPALGRSIGIEVYRAAARKAQATPSLLPRFRQLYLGCRVREVSRFLDLPRWDACATSLSSAGPPAGTQVHIGLDLSTTTDFTAAVMLWREGEAWQMRSMCWLPEDRVDDLEYRCKAPLKDWAAQGWVRLTEGEVVDYAQVRADLIAWAAKLGLTVAPEVDFDPWNATETTQELDRHGWPIVEVKQNYSTLSPSLKEIERAVLGETLAHDGSPVARWMADSLEVRQNQDGSLKPAKPDRRSASHRIDIMSALATAMSRAMTAPVPKQSAYETRGLAVAGARRRRR